MILKDAKGNLFQLDDFLTEAPGKPESSVLEPENSECLNCPYQGMCEEQEESTSAQPRILFFEISTN